MAIGARFRLVPQTREFYARFDRSASNLVATAGLLLDLLEEFPERRELVAEIKEREHEGDRATKELVRLLHKTFVTPFDREDIYNLATALDDVCDFMDEAADEFNLYALDEIPPETIEQARLTPTTRMLSTPDRPVAGRLTVSSGVSASL